MFGLYATVSIHAPREGERLRKFVPANSDVKFQSTLPARGSDCRYAVYRFTQYVSIHAPREGERLAASNLPNEPRQFQSTLPARGSDLSCCLPYRQSAVSIHAPREGERPCSRQFVRSLPCFNPRSPRGGATYTLNDWDDLLLAFQSTLPARGSDIHSLIPGISVGVFQSTLPARGSDTMPL